MNSEASRVVSRLGTRSGWTHQATAWLLFAPPAVMLGVRWLLQLMVDRAGGVPALPLAPVATAADVMDVLWPVLLGCALLAVVIGLMRRFGSQRVLPVLGVAWLALWLVASGMLVQRYLNRQGLWLQDAQTTPAAAVMAKVLSQQIKAASLRSLGGTELVLSVPGIELPQRLLIEEARSHSFKAGDTLALQLANGRFGGWFVTAWQAAPVAPL